MRRIKFAPGKIYHIFNRGVEKRTIFQNDSDRWRFLQALFLFNDEAGVTNLLYRLERDKKAMNFRVLRDYLSKGDVRRKPLVCVMAYCLKNNHFHLLLEEIQENGISRFMQKLGTGYTGYFNKKYERVGSLFQSTFKAVPIETDVQLQYILVYINVMNPGQEIEPKLKEEGSQYPEKILKFAEGYWSTHQEYLEKRDSMIIDKGIAANIFSTPEQYQDFARNMLIRKTNTEDIKRLFLE